METSIIIVDDDKDTVSVFQEFLEFKGFKVLGVGYNGKDAVELYNNFKPDVVLLDVMMPEFNGFYALQKIREVKSDAKIIMITADKTKKTEERLIEMNASAILYKPYEIDNLVKTIKDMLNTKNSESLKPKIIS